jgi:hypothetical protein
MRINAITNQGYTPCRKSDENKPSFTAMTMKKEFLEEMIAKRLFTEEGFQQLANTMRSHFNLRQVADYDNRTPGEKEVLDRLFAKYGEKEVNDVTVEIGRSDYSEIDFELFTPVFGDRSRDSLVTMDKISFIDPGQKGADRGSYIPTPKLIEKYLRRNLDLEVEKLIYEGKIRAKFNDIMDLFK